MGHEWSEDALADWMEGELSDEIEGTGVRAGWIKLTGGDGKKFTFENPQHDFPQKITYEKIDDDTVRASIAGPKGGKEVGEAWEYKRVK